MSRMSGGQEAESEFSVFVGLKRTLKQISGKVRDRAAFARSSFGEFAIHAVGKCDANAIG